MSSLDLAAENKKLRTRVRRYENIMEKLALDVDDRDDVTIQLSELVQKVRALMAVGKQTLAASKPPPPSTGAAAPELAAVPPEPAPEHVVPASNVDLSPTRFAGNCFGRARHSMCQTFPSTVDLQGGERFFYPKRAEWFRVVGYLPNCPKFNIVCVNAAKLEQPGVFCLSDYETFAEDFVVEQVFGSDVGKGRRGERIDAQAERMGIAHAAIRKSFRMFTGKQSYSTVEIYDINKNARKNPIVVQCQNRLRYGITLERLTKNLDHDDEHSLSLYEHALETCHDKGEHDLSDFDPDDLKWIRSGVSIFKPGGNGRPSSPTRLDLIGMDVYPMSLKSKQGAKRPRM